MLILLAINVGSADLAPEIFRDLDTAAGQSFLAWITQTSRNFEEKLSAFKSARPVQPENSGPDTDELRLRELIRGLAKIQSCLGEVQQLLKDSHAPSFDDRLAVFKKWVPEVGPYSFRSHLMAKAQLLER